MNAVVYQTRYTNTPKVDETGERAAENTNVIAFYMAGGALAEELIAFIIPITVLP